MDMNSSEKTSCFMMNIIVCKYIYTVGYVAI